MYGRRRVSPTMIQDLFSKLLVEEGTDSLGEDVRRDKLDHHPQTPQVEGADGDLRYWVHPALPIVTDSHLSFQFLMIATSTLACNSNVSAIAATRNHGLAR